MRFPFRRFFLCVPWGGVGGWSNVKWFFRDLQQKAADQPEIRTASDITVHSQHPEIKLESQQLNHHGGWYLGTLRRGTR